MIGSPSGPSQQSTEERERQRERDREMEREDRGREMSIFVCTCTHTCIYTDSDTCVHVGHSVESVLER